MAAPADFLRRTVAWSVDVALVVVIAVPLLAWQFAGLPAEFAAAVDAMQARIEALLLAALDGLGDPGGFPSVFALARGWLDDPPLRAAAEAIVFLVLDAIAVAALVIVTVAAVWFVGFEASAKQATPGKAALGLRVTDVAGARPPFGRIAGRFLAGAPSWALLHLGHAMAAWTRDRRALHDLIAGTRVEQREPPGTPLPAWARAWLVAWAIAVAGGTAALIVAYARLLAGV
jgi:uncharacterized RDD family membrane protein YckC